jgi:TonB-linked SusC/RagA family outer membrane protein
MKKRLNCYGHNPWLNQIARKMKLTILLITSVILSGYASDSYSQAARLTLNMENSTIGNVLKAIENQSEFRFFYSGEVNTETKASLSVSNKNVMETLDELFRGTGIRYDIYGRQIALLAKQETALPAGIQQTGGITGKVTDRTGGPLPGVTVVVKGTTTGTITDGNGNYSLSNIPANSTLVFSFVGMSTQEIAVGNQRVIGVTMAEETIGIEEVVAVGYGTQRKETLTGSVSQISGEQISNRVSPNIVTALQGAIPNVNVGITSAGGEPGATQTINIRGFASISGGNPLVIVDGVEQRLDNVNPADVETISVLKDATATAIYGTRAAFGVINITTKRGKDASGKVSFNVNSNVAWNAPTVLPRFATSVEDLETRNTAFVNAGQAPFIPQETIDRARQYLENPGSIPTTLPNPANPTQWGTWTVANANVDWLDALYKDWAYTQQHNVSMSGGGASARYFVSGNLYDQGSQMNWGDHRFQRYSFVANVDADITNWFTVKFNNRYTRRNSDFPYVYSGIGDYYHGISRMWSNYPIYDPNGNLLINALLMLDEGGRSIRKENELINSVQAVLEPVKNWKINADINFRQNFNITGNHHKTIYRTLVDGVTQIKETHTFPNNYNETQANNYFNTNNVYSSYDLKIGKHSTTFLAGFQNELYKYGSLYGRRDDLVTEALPSISTATGQIYLSGSKGHWATLSYFGRINYSFADKYLLEIVGRHNGSSRFPVDGRWSFFPAVSLGYNIAKEDFWTGSKFTETVSQLKLRASYGENGNQDVANYLYLPSMGINQNLGWIAGGVRPIFITAPGLISPDVTWETVKTTNFGLDALAFNSRLSFNFDYYIRATLNMFGPAESLPAVLGASAPRRNNADLETKGFETEISWRDQIGELRYNVRFSLADNTTTITRYKNVTGTLSDYYVGREIGEIWGYTSMGFYQTDAEAAAGPDQKYLYSKWGAGDMEYKDLNDDKKINNGKNTLEDHGDLSIIGNTTPRYTYGIDLGLQWKNFDMSIFGQGVGKRDLWLSGNLFFGVVGNVWQTGILREHLDFWKPDNTDAYYPKPYMTSEHDKNIQVQTHFLQNASYFRIKNFQFGYTLPGTLSNKIRMENVRVFFTGENLVTFTKIATMFDPEATGGGNGNGKLYPLAKTVSFGVNVKF